MTTTGTDDGFLSAPPVGVDGGVDPPPPPFDEPDMTEAVPAGAAASGRPDEAVVLDAALVGVAFAASGLSEVIDFVLSAGTGVAPADD